MRRRRAPSAVRSLDPETIAVHGAMYDTIRDHLGEPAPYPFTAPDGPEAYAAGVPVITRDGEVVQLPAEAAIDNRLRALQATVPRQFAEGVTAFQVGREGDWAEMVRRSRRIEPLIPERGP